MAAHDCLNSAVHHNITRDTDSLRRRISENLEGLEEEFSCSVCLRPVVQPTTLTCGHTSCRVCLAKWYFNSMKKECPLCRQPYHGHPRTNTQIRNMMEKLYPDMVREREEELQRDSEAREIVKKFDKKLAKDGRKSEEKEQSDIASFCAGIIIAFCGFVVVYLAWYWQSSETNLLVTKPVQTWKPKDVVTWLKEMTWAGVYADMAIEKNIDGNMLLSMNAQGLRELLNVTDTNHERAFLFAIQLLQDQGLKMPASLWEYKAIYPGRCLFLVYGMKDFPRTSLLYMWLYFQDEMFLPFVRATTKVQEDPTNPPNSTVTQEISWSEWVSFLFYATVLPEWLVVVFTSQMFTHHTITPFFVLATAILHQVLEILTWISFFKMQNFRQMYPFLKQYSKLLMTAFMFMIVWPVVPTFLCDVLFYGALYISPVHASKAVYQRLRELNHA